MAIVDGATIVTSLSTLYLANDKKRKDVLTKIVERATQFDKELDLV